MKYRIKGLKLMEQISPMKAHFMMLFPLILSVALLFVLLMIKKMNICCLLIIYQQHMFVFM